MGTQCQFTVKRPPKCAVRSTATTTAAASSAAATATATTAATSTASAATSSARKKPYEPQHTSNIEESNNYLHE